MSTGHAAALDGLEAAFGTRPLADLCAGIAALLPELDDDPGLRARALGDLGVIAHAMGDAAAAADHFEHALDAVPGYEPALTGLASLVRASGDGLQAVALARQAALAEPGDAERWRSLSAYSAEAGLWPLAGEAARRILALAPGDPGAAELERRAVQALGPQLPPSHRLLVAVERFHPSTGGSERLAEDAALALRDRGWQVDVVTRAMDERESREHRGLRIHEVRLESAQHELAAIVARGAYDAILAFATPASWPVLAPLALAHPRPRVVVVPCVNGQVDAELRADRRLLRHYEALLTGADAIGHSSLDGLDRRLCADLHLRSAYLPNAVHADAADHGAAERLGLAPGEPFALVVGNHWPEKDHLGLLAHLQLHDDDLRVVLVGGAAPELPELSEEIARQAARDPRVILAGPRGREEVSGLMDAASLLLLPSKVEATPLVILEAMSHGLPWIATPGAGAVHDHAGGLIVGLERFLPAARALLAQPAATERLGAAGREHWAASYSWERLAARYDALLRGADVLPSLDAPPAALAATAAVRDELLGRAAA
ncbi:MAG TPA: glycosyltransferase family 4 protein [Baekduia sp.]|nr:glycosyltransferase family 4 protein [Baekduia sp.]